MEPRIIKQCEEAMYDAIWLELDRDPCNQRLQG